ncbi:hypothetical protein J2S40_001119 [Nocardioides luteus]|uniref:Uncharacterized protein n=1 Tax=Nocardioides luteus TaxID=1844 RepID=A0ABQ5SSB1_9ACTN|nr:hypothetical protein [Nocardioides luteus]MDR7310061.1 hypothetical protein [Nocardioides luteus]GGR65095.1 hypothetical protein GCM10010197_35690 [Nocardioides luteus]GLJ67030.1 hypothetical protein GCM10017579_10660 [Nocardioides luteus]
MSERWVPTLWAAVLAVLMLGPALGPGFVLTYDMVWVPDLALTSDVLGLGTGLPRAVPSDAVVAVLDEVIPGLALQKIVLVGALVLAGAGAAELTRHRSLTARVAVVSLTLWSPYVAERLWMGHWPMLLAYAAVPWLVIAGRRWAAGERSPVWLLPVLIAGSLSASAGILTGAVPLATGLRRGRRPVLLLVALLAVNAPWLVTGLAHTAEATASSGFEVFALRGDALPAPLAALALGGIWNTSVVPDSRESWLAWPALLLLAALVAAGARRWWTSESGRAPILALWVAGLAIALAGWIAPLALDDLARHVPGLALFRDSSRLLPLGLPLLVLTAAAGIDAVRERLRGTAPRWAAAVVVALAPIAVLPDAAWGLAGGIGTAEYPDQWQQARAALEEETAAGDVLVLPWSSYRAPEWNGARPVLDPLPRMLTRPSVVNGDLVVGSTAIEGEDPRATAAAEALAEADPETRSAALSRLGIGYVITDRTAGDSAQVSGETVFEGSGLLLQRMPERSGPLVGYSTGPVALAAVAGAWAAYAVAWLVATTSTVLLLISIVRRQTARVPG